MAITVNNIQTSTTDTLNYTPSAVSNSVLSVSVSSEDASGDMPITAIDFDGTPMVLVGVAQGFIGASPIETATAYLVNPGTSSGLISITGGQPGEIGIIALTLGNVDQSSPLDTSNISDEVAAVTTTTTSSTTTNNDSLILSACGYGNVGALSVGGASILSQIQPASSRLGVALSFNISPSVYSHVWSVGVANRMSAISAAFNLAAAASVSISVTETRSSREDSSTTSVVSSFSAAVTESRSARLNSVSVDIAENLSFATTEIKSSRLDSSSINVVETLLISTTEVKASRLNSSILMTPTDISLSVTETRTARVDLAALNVKIKVTVNPKNIIRVKASNNTIRVIS